MGCIIVVTIGWLATILLIVAAADREASSRLEMRRLELDIEREKTRREQMTWKVKE